MLSTNVSRRRYVAMAASLGLLAMLAIPGYFYLQSAQRHHLVCDVMKPGMSKEQVIGTLEHIGNFTMSEGDWGNGEFVLGIAFTNQGLAHQYGSFGLAFTDYKYYRAFISHGSDNPDIICDFLDVVEAATKLPGSTP